MAEPTELTPPELDRIEDALEDLENGPIPQDVAPQVRARLESFQEILQMSRQALPMEEVPAGLLDAVFAEARGEAGSMATQESGVTATGVDDVHAEAVGGGGGFWKQLRRTFAIPALALAGSAAVVLWMISPEVGKMGEGRTVDEATAAAEAPAPAAAPVSSADRELSDDARERAKLEEDKDSIDGLVETRAQEEQVPAEEAARPEMEPEPAASPAAPEPKPAAKRKKSSGKSDMKDPFGGGGYPETKNSAPAKPAPTQDPGGASMTWSQIADADGKRRARRCGLARIIYRKAIETADSRIAARGHAGLGLCAEQGGDSPDAHFARARKLDPGIQAFITDERARAYRPGAKASKKKAAPPAAAEQADDVGDTY